MTKLAKALVTALCVLPASCTHVVHAPPQRIAERISTQHHIMQSFRRDIEDRGQDVKIHEVIGPERMVEILLIDAKAWQHLYNWVRVHQEQGNARRETSGTSSGTRHGGGDVDHETAH